MNLKLNAQVLNLAAAYPLWPRHLLKLLCCISFTFCSLVNASSLLSENLNNIGIDQNLNSQIPLSLSFHDDQKRVVSIQKLVYPKPTILVLTYFGCPSLCTLVLNNLVETLEEMKGFDLGQDYNILTVSIDPSETSALASKKRNTYLQRYGHRGNPEGWRFLTGNKKTIDALAKVVGFKYKYDPATRQFAHASGIMILTPQGIISRYFLGIGYSPQDLRLSLIEASSGKVGSLVDKIALLCYEYNPITGKYGVSITRLLKLFSIITVLFLLILIFQQNWWPMQWKPQEKKAL